jgi:HEAT repeat protein
LRRLEGAVPLLMRSAEDPDADVRRAALDTISVLGTEQQAGGLVRLLSSTGNADTRDEIERALSAICRRSGVRALPQVLPLAQTGNTALRKVGLRALASIGGAEGLAAVKTAAQDRDESIQDEAVNLLSTWPNTWPEDAGVAEPLLNLVKSGKKPSYQSQALRGYLQFIEETKTLNTDDKLAKLSDLLGFLKGADEKRQIISVVGTVPSPKSLELLLTAAQDQAVAEESYMAALKVATDRKLRDSSKELRRKALETVAEKAQDEATKKKAGEELKKIR